MTQVINCRKLAPKPPNRKKKYKNKCGASEIVTLHSGKESVGQGPRSSSVAQRFKGSLGYLSFSYKTKSQTPN